MLILEVLCSAARGFEGVQLVDAPIGALIRTADGGDAVASRELFAALYRELHAIAERELRRSPADATLGTTTLLHEAYLAISAREGARFPDRARFLAYASRAMRGLLIDYLRHRRAQKRGGEFRFVTLTTAPGSGGDALVPERLDRLSDALEALDQVDPALAELVDLHFFSGFAFVEIAQLRGVSERAVRYDWQKARVLLRSSLEDIG
jgi:RNA polymerase sigma factor (TIGR02999 family)